MTGEPEGNGNSAVSGRRHRYLLFELTKSCQNNCVFCYNVWKEDDEYPGAELATADATRLLDKVISESGCEIIGLSGGEPLLRQDIAEIASFITSRAVSPILITNGKLVNKEMAARCAEAGVRMFEVSLHSNKEALHDRLAGRTGNFKEVIDAIVNIRDAGAQVSTVYVATKANIHTFKDTVEVNALLGVRWVLFNRVACGGAGIPRWAAMVPSPDDIKRALESAAGVAEKHGIGISAGVQIPPCLVDLNEYGVASGFCPLNDSDKDNSYFTIDPAGNLRMCNRSTTILGNLLESPFDVISRDSRVQALADATPDFCLDCKLGAACAGGCKADALSCYGTLERADPYVEMWKHQAKKIH
jgi:radical SAM protein with 4Fe4S-binding SPASM domain